MPTDDMKEDDQSSSPVLRRAYHKNGTRRSLMNGTASGPSSSAVSSESEDKGQSDALRHSPLYNRKSRRKTGVIALQDCPQKGMDSQAMLILSQKKTKNQSDIYNLLSPLRPKRIVLDGMQSTGCFSKNDSFEDINFDELEDIFSAMSTPKSSISKEGKRKHFSAVSTPKSSISKEDKRKHFSAVSTPKSSISKEGKRKHFSAVSTPKNSISKDSIRRHGRLCTTPKRLKCEVEHEFISEKNNDIGNPEEAVNSISTNQLANASLLGEFGEEDSLDLFEDIPSPKSQIFPLDNGRKSEIKSEFDDIEAIFENSFEVEDGQCDLSREVKNSSLIREDNKSQLRNSSGEIQLQVSSGSEEKFQRVSSSRVPSDRFDHRALNSDSQLSFTSVMDSQPLIGRLQDRLEGLRSSQPSAVQTEKDRRAEAVAAAVDEAAKHHESECEFELGPFFGLPSTVADVLEKHRGITELYDWQKNCIAEGSGSRNLLFSLPTSGGKTLVAEILILRQLLLKKKGVIFILPYVALVQEKVHGLSPFGIELGFLIEEYAGSRGCFPPKIGRKKSVLYIATIEKAAGLVNSFLEDGRIGELGLVVADEVHMIGENSGRGAILEGTLTKLRYAASKVQLVAMSATLGNLQEIASFLDAKLFTGDFRPVSLSEYVKIGDQIWEVNKSARTEDELLYKQRLCCFPYTKEQKKIDVDLIGGLVGEVVPKYSCIVFCPTRRNCETVAELVCLILPEELKQNRRKDKVALYRAIVEEGGGTVCPTLRKTIPYGIAYHHSGLTEGERRLIEEGYLTGTLCCLCCTSTLAAGINLPARRVIIRAPYTGSEFLTQSRYKQMVGRAGRAGLDTCGESFLLLQPRDIKQAGNLLLSPMDVCHSTLLDRDEHGLILLLFSSIGLGIARSLSSLKALVYASLLCIQSSESLLDVEDRVVAVVNNLHKKGFIKGQQDAEPSSLSSLCGVPSNSSSSGVSKGIISTKASSSEECDMSPVTDSDMLTVSRLGRAAIKGNIDLDLASMLYHDLIIARESLAVNSYLHLLYIVVPYDIASNVKIGPDILYKAFLALGEEELKVAKLLGISEAIVIKISMGQESKKLSKSVLQRFYVCLILHEMWLGKGVWEVSDLFRMHRGFTQQLLSASSAFASCIQHFCQELEELWAFRDLLHTFSRQLSGCCSAELLPLLDLPAVKKGRAKMLYKAGYRTLHNVANANAQDLVKLIDHMPYRTATQLINSAKMLLLERAESLQGEADEVLSGLHQQPGTTKSN